MMIRSPKRSGARSPPSSPDSSITSVASSLASQIGLEMETMPDFLPGIDDFEKARWENSVERRKALAEKTFKVRYARYLTRKPWLDDGAAGLASLNQAKAGLTSILGPHQDKRQCVEELNFYIHNLFHEEAALPASHKKTIFSYSRSFAVRLLYFIKPPPLAKAKKVDLIRWKRVVLRELKRAYARNPFTMGLVDEMPLSPEEEQEQRLEKESASVGGGGGGSGGGGGGGGDQSQSQSQSSNQHKPARVRHHGETRALRVMDQSQRFLVPIEPSLLKLLHNKRIELRQARMKLDLIESTSERWAKIPLCESMLHMTPAGCPKCFVIHLGAASKPEQFVKSVNRESGLETLVKLEFELAALAEEKIVQEVRIEEILHSIKDLEIELFIRARDAIQAWWPCVLARWRSQREDRIRVHSIYYYRIRRLSRLKRQIDNTLDNDLKTNFDAIALRYSDCNEELEEYVAKISGERNEIGLRVAKVFLQKLRTAVARARKKAYLRAEAIEREKNAALNAISDKKRALFLLKTRKMVLKWERTKFCCIRPKCDNRKFFSRDRYETHMKIHKIEDALREARYEQIRTKASEREAKEALALDRIASVRLAVLRAGADSVIQSVESSRMAMVDPLTRQLGDVDFAQRVAWTSQQEHFRQINANQNSSLYHLELVSKRGDVAVAARVPLNASVIRIGTLASVEVPVLCTGALKHSSAIAKVHCLLYCPQAGESGGITIVDNHTNWGTYVVSLRSEGVRKVTTLVTKGVAMTPGDLLCIAVKERGPEILDATTASAAAIVFRLKCSDVEHQQDGEEDEP